MSKGFASSYRIIILATTLFVCFAALGVRLIWLHVVDRDSLLERITEVRVRVNPETARRGDILDNRGAPLAASSSRRMLAVDPMSLRPQDEKMWPQLAALIGMPEPELRKIFLTKFREPAPATPVSMASAIAKPAGLVFNLKLSDPAPVREDKEEDAEVDPTPDEKGRRAIRWVKLRDDVSDPVYEEIQKLGIKGVFGQHVYQRAYPNKQLAAHVVGFVNRQQQPAAGMEAYADFFLQGRDGWRVGERDGCRHRMGTRSSCRSTPSSRTSSSRNSPLSRRRTSRNKRLSSSAIPAMDLSSQWRTIRRSTRTNITKSPSTKNTG
jgi:cell division protein FtsI (penicillin-binding protein 3)